MVKRTGKRPSLSRPAIEAGRGGKNSVDPRLRRR